MRRAGALAVGGLLCASLLACGADDRPRSRPRLVLLYAPCTLNAEYLSPYAGSTRGGLEVDFTPHVQAFADDAVVFERHMTEAGQSGIAYASLLSGSQADHHQIYRHPKRLGDAVRLLAETYRDEGFDTFFWNDHPLASPLLGYARGVPVEHRMKLRLEPDDETFEEILDSLASDPSYHAYVQTNFTMTHTPYRSENLPSFLASRRDALEGLPQRAVSRALSLHRDHHVGLSYAHTPTVGRLKLPPAEIEGLYRVLPLLYASNVEQLDRHFGSIVDAIRERGLLDESLIVFTADHGEVVERRDALYPWSHAMQPAREVLRVPLLVREPGGGGGRRYESVSRSIDVMPTMLALSGIQLPKGPPGGGQNLSDSMRGSVEEPRLLAFSHTSVLVREIAREMGKLWPRRQWATLREYVPDEGVERIWATIRDRDMVYQRVRRGDGPWRYLAYDLAKDPEERTNLFRADDPTHREMRERLDEYWRHLVERHMPEGPLRSPEQAADEADSLRALGYIE